MRSRAPWFLGLTFHYETILEKILVAASLVSASGERRVSRRFEGAPEVVARLGPELAARLLLLGAQVIREFERIGQAGPPNAVGGLRAGGGGSGFIGGSSGARPWPEAGRRVGQRR
jgi:hypothetical protein